DGYTTVGGSDSANATKTFEDIVISITPASATNPVNAPHTFTATVLINRGDGNGFVVDVGAPVTITLADQNGAVANPAGPFSGVTYGSGHFTATFSSLTAGQLIGGATTSLTLNALPVALPICDGYTTVGGSDSPNAIKTFEDIVISITPASATNPVN